MGWYPHGKSPTLAYTKKFQTVGHDYSGMSYVNTRYPGLGAMTSSIPTTILSNLQSLISAARNSEVAFMSATGFNLQDPNSAKEIFTVMNKIFNSKDTFNRGMQYMQKLAQKGDAMQKGDMYRDVSRYFGFYLGKALEEELPKIGAAQIVTMNKGQIESLINQIISSALEKTYTAVKDFVGPDGEIRGKFGKDAKAVETKGEKEQEVQAITDMITTIRDLATNHQAFGKYGYLFNLNATSLAEMASTGKILINGKKFSNAHVDANFGGNALELITSVVAAEIGNINIKGSGLTITGVHTGQMNQMKADTMLFVGRGDINPNDYMQYVRKTGSVRMENITAMQQYLADLERNIEHVIMISDKNYSITANFGGVNAQEKMSLANAGPMLMKFGVGNVDALINYLANCGPSMVQGDAVDGQIRTMLQSYIGYFLFDHLSIQASGPPPGPNVVNLMNVSGMYIPLSVYLEGLYNSIQEAIGSPSSLVSVTISLGGQTEQSVWTAGTWQAFRQSHETQSFISYRILRGLANFITGLG